MEFDLAVRAAAQPPPRKVDPADNDGQHIVEIVGDPAGELADRLHFLDLAKTRLGCLALGRLGFEPLIGLQQLCGPLAHRLFEPLGPAIFVVGLVERLDPFAHRPEGGKAEGDRSEPDQDREPAQPSGHPVGLVARRPGRAHPAPEVGPLGGCDLGQLGAKRRTGLESARLEEIIDPADALLEPCRGDRDGELLASFLVEPAKLAHPGELVGSVPDQPLELVNLLPCRLPFVVIKGGGAAILVEHVAAERGLGPGDGSVGGPGQEHHVVAVPLRGEGLVARLVGRVDHQQQDDEQGRGEDRADRRQPATPPVRGPSLGNVRELTRHGDQTKGSRRGLKLGSPPQGIASPRSGAAQRP